ncbi:MAG: hypothetical protein IJB66_04160 [Oscillospiraceae bacterium]|nr:hypothetical protein [Oscillospiraceae bacterium]
MRKKVFFIPTERYSDFNSMIERYEQEMRRIFAEKQRISGFEEPAAETAVFPEDAPAVPEFQQREQDNIKVPEPEREEKAQPLPEIVPDGIGHIIVEVTTARGAVPLSGVDVVIDRLDTDDAKGRQELITVETTNQSGRTKPVAVKTLSRELSLVPGNGNPFSTFYVTAAEKGFEPVKSRPVDVFSNEVSILKIDLIPKPENLYGGGANG